MKLPTVALALGLAFTCATSSNAQGHRAHSAPQVGASADIAVEGVHVRFSAGDARIIRDHYAPRYRNLPPGLHKKLARTGTLPPGWQKKMEPFPLELERRLARLPDGYRRGVIDGQAVIYVPGTSVVIDAAVLF